ncbi:hypothetical protein DF186_22610, partial [Enterococcus hirae]
MTLYTINLGDFSLAATRSLSEISVATSGGNAPRVRLFPSAGRLYIMYMPSAGGAPRIGYLENDRYFAIG